MNYWERQRWREWFAEIDREMDANLGIWIRLFLR